MIPRLIYSKGDDTMCLDFSGQLENFKRIIKAKENRQTLQIKINTANRVLTIIDTDLYLIN